MYIHIYLIYLFVTSTFFISNLYVAARLLTEIQQEWSVYLDFLLSEKHYMMFQTIQLEITALAQCPDM